MADAAEQPMPPDENRGPEILAVCGSLVGIALFIVALRIWVRAKIVRHIGSDDWTIMAAMLVMFVEMMVIIPQVQVGGGRHVQYIQPPENVVKGLHLNFVTQPLCLIALCFTKVSVGLFLLRLTPSPKFRYFVIGMIVFTIMSHTGNLLTVFFQCRPLALAWDHSVEGECLPPTHLKFAAFFNSAVAALTDVVFALLPVPILWNVQMNWKVKSAVAAILSLGVFAAASAIVKITFLESYGKHGDFLWDSVDITIWYVSRSIHFCTHPTKHYFLATTGRRSKSTSPSSPPPSRASSPSSSPCSTAPRPPPGTAPSTRATSATATPAAGQARAIRGRRPGRGRGARRRPTTSSSRCTTRPRASSPPTSRRAGPR
ncbi:hypothetical protein N658DRAFT_171645 [Parathielavia hyrcaniae]|uniref:Rhodopsin domain-containing protein n=1 Tax=Parathielavia hyrcaniae TaxID=113614 RepID=A0AAN6Q012_9PEZI|nr:hypothetical protein N658DRAFT_171645 [Parathielavia hyrcaniae]